MTDVAIQKVEMTPQEIETLVQAQVIPKGTPEAVIKIFAHVCKEKNLSPFSKQIHLIPFNVKVGDKWETRYATITGIDGYRAIAERTGRYAGNDDYRYNEGITEYQCRKQEMKHPVTATATVYKIVGNERIPFTATAAWASYYPGEKKGFSWDRMPYFMLGKVAEALALRKAFPEQLNNLYAEEERVAIETVQLNAKETISQEEIEISAGILAALKKEADAVKTQTEIKVNGEDWIKQAEDNACLPEHISELKKYLNKKFIELKENEAGTAPK